MQKLKEHNHLLFQYNTVATWADKDDFKPCFYIPKLDLYIDHFPYDNLKEYQKIMKAKVKQYEKYKRKHIYFTSDDEKNILHMMLEDKESGYRAKIILLKDEGYTVPQIRKITNHHMITT